MFSQGAARSAFRLSTLKTPFSAKSTIFKAAATTQTRLAATSSATTQDDAYSILVAQRKNRPVSPHLSIYQPQLTWYGSGAGRVTGSIISGGAYTFFAAYAVAPVFGWHLDSVTLAAAFGSLSIAAKVGLKASLALPFTYHSLNGMKHLVWDTGKALDLKGVYRTGYAVLGLTAVSTIYLAML